MTTLRDWVGAEGRRLAARLDRLTDDLEGLAGRLGRSVAEALGEAFAGAVRDAVAGVLGATGPGRRPAGDRYRPGGRVPDYWDDPDAFDEPDGYDRFGRRPPDGVRGDPPGGSAGRWGGLIRFACRSATAWVRRHRSWHPRLAALLVAVLTVLEELVGRSAGGAASAIERLAALAGAVQAGAAALNPP